MGSDPEIEAQRARAVALGNAASPSGAHELEDLLRHPAPMVRRAAASAVGKLLAHNSDVRGLFVVPLSIAIEKEDRPQVLQYLLKALRLCSESLNLLQVDVLRDIVRNPNWPDYVRQAANNVLSDAEEASARRQARLQHWCARCRKIVSEEEARRSREKYGKPYCHHCFEEKLHEDAVFESDVEAAKKMRTVDEVAVQSRGEKRIGDWLSAHRIAYRYDERMMVAGGVRIRPDFYLPEYDLYIEYWGMNTPEYMESRRRKMILYQREKKKLISLSYRDDAQLESLLEEKLSHHMKI